MIVQIIIFVVSLLVVVKSADWFLGAAEKVGVSLRLPPFILGVVLVGFGTSLPELATSLAAVNDGVNTIALANVAGSNIANIFVIVGLSTIAMGTIRFDKNLIDLDIPLLLGVTALFCIMLVDGSITRGDGILLLLGFAGYIVYSIGYNEDEAYHKGLIRLIASLAKGSNKKVEKRENIMGPMTVVILIVSVGLLGVASKISVDSLLRIVAEVNVGVDVISFFALAIGTSLPELVVSVKALRRGQGDMLVGNIIGSNMFNILLIAGIAGTITPQALDLAIVPWVITGMSLSVLLITAGSISKRIHIWEGFVYVLIYLTIASKIIQI